MVYLSLFCKHFSLTDVICIFYYSITQGQQSIVQRFDALDVNLQLLLKVAAVVGIQFSVDALRKIYETLAFNALLIQSVQSVERGRSQNADRRTSPPLSSRLYSRTGLRSCSPKPHSTLNSHSPSGRLTPHSPAGRPIPHSPAGRPIAHSPVGRLMSHSPVSVPLLASPGSVLTSKYGSSSTTSSSSSVSPTRRNGLDKSPSRHHHHTSANPITLPRQSSAYEMYQRNNIENDIEKLVDLGMFTHHEFDGVQLHQISKKEMIQGVDKNNSVCLDDSDSPEIGIHAWQWHDAKGLRRRGWAAIIAKRDSEKERDRRKEFGESKNKSSDISREMKEKEAEKERIKEKEREKENVNGPGKMKREDSGSSSSNSSTNSSANNIFKLVENGITLLSLSPVRGGMLGGSPGMGVKEISPPKNPPQNKFYSFAHASIQSESMFF